MFEHATRVMTRLSDTLDDPIAWEGVLDEIKQAVSAPHVLIAERDATGALMLGERPWEQPFVSGYDGEVGGRPYIEYYRHFDTWDKYEAGGRRTGPVLVSRAPGHAIREMSEFQDWLRPLDINENAYMKLFDTPGGWVGLNIHFPARSADIDYMLEFMRLIWRPLAKHVSVALSGVQGCPKANLENRIESAAHPQFVLTSDGRIEVSNAAADAMVTKKAGILRRNGALIFDDTEVHLRFHAALKAVASTNQPEIIVVPWADGPRATEVLLTPERSEIDAFRMPRTRVLVTFVVDTGPGPLITPLARAYSLNHTETAILHQTEKGLDNKSIAQAIGRSDVHVRKTLSEIYAKLGIDNRHELAALIGRLHRAMP